MKFITDQKSLDAFCFAASREDYIAIDTEFIREDTYFSKLCLVQVAFEGGENAACIDPLAQGLSLEPLLTLMRDSSIVKVFHAARQDLEIFYHDYDVLPVPFFDTQIAAMVAGFGEQAGYETLVRRLTQGRIDKSSRFTDWSRRPLTLKQLTYALGDVTHLREIYKSLKMKLEQTGRLSWVEEEFQTLLDPKLYEIDPEEQWRKVRIRSDSPKFLMKIKLLAALREKLAREKNKPRQRIFKDEAMLELAAQMPETVDSFRKLRLWPKDGGKTGLNMQVLKVLASIDKIHSTDYPRLKKRSSDNKASESVSDLLRVLLKSCAEKNEVAPRLVASSADLEAFAIDPEGAHPLKEGWRYEVFGADALKLVKGEFALRPQGKYVEVIKVC